MAISFFSATAAAENELTAEQIRDGWISLFDGETLFGWLPTSDVDWQVAEGEIRATEGSMGLLATTTQFADYEFHLEFKASAKAKGGLFLRTPRYGLDLAADNVWHAYDVRIEGEQILVRLDGRLVPSDDDSKLLKRGHIGLQFNQGPIAFRNIRLKPLGMKPIFNGRDLEGWNTDLAEKSRFEVTVDGELRVLDGKGQIESEGRYGDFVLQLECFVAGDSLNSGIFFRCIPGDMMMGYESQIHNGMKDDDPTQPADCGTGGIFRRQNARRIVARDHEWFSKTLIADGPHIAVWVNGFQVSDWTDERKPHENPRKGLRLEPGTLAIQGHDPTTDLRFRNFQVADLPEE
ncbi:MAG: DUF1080 domain-containing protein [Planctomycetes bacterium]|nr:DUF1080 domain-containing protein [Planctomycetota bacterium]